MTHQQIIEKLIWSNVARGSIGNVLTAKGKLLAEQIDDYISMAIMCEMEKRTIIDNLNHNARISKREAEIKIYNYLKSVREEMKA